MDSLLGPLRRYGNFAIRGRSQAVEVWTFSMAPAAT
jgi:hypothetical protein